MLVIAGYGSNIVDVYNRATGSWTTAQLSTPRQDLAAASFGNSIIFAGGSYLGAFCR
jgi:hypothetical protein